MNTVTALRAMPYEQYLLTPEWQQKRTARLRAAGWACQVCCSQARLNVHHRTYARLGQERDMDLIVLCRKCHRLYHENGRLSSPPPARWRSSPQLTLPV